MKPRHTLEEAQERAALHALGALDADEARAYVEHLESGCEVCAAEVASFAEVADDLAMAAPPQAPSERVRAAFLEALATPVIEVNGVRFVRSQRLDWQGSAAISRKSLFRDAGRGFGTQIVRMAPGAQLAPHRHAEAEEIYIIEGDLTLAGFTMHAGDYCRAEADSIHETVHTTNGCVFLVLSSEHDEKI